MEIQENKANNEENKTEAPSDPDLEEVMGYIAEFNQDIAVDETAARHYEGAKEALALLDEAKKKAGQAEEIIKKLIEERQAKNREIEKEIKALK